MRRVGEWGRHQSNQQAWISNIAFGIGGAAIVGSVGAKLEGCPDAPWNRKDQIDPHIEGLLVRHCNVLEKQLSKAPPASPHAPNFRAQRAKLARQTNCNENE